jgi:hypothetical protein
LQPFIGDPHNRAQAERIKLTVDAIKAGKSTAEVMRIMRGDGAAQDAPPPAQKPQDKPGEAK